MKLSRWLPVGGVLFLMTSICESKSTQTSLWGSSSSSLKQAEQKDSNFSSPENLLFGDLATPANVNNALNDFQNRLSSDFKVPDQIRDRVEFWLRIYTEFTTQHLVLFDRYHPNIIYEALDFRSLSAEAKTPIVYEILRKKKITQALDRYRRAFDRLNRNPNPKNPSSEELKILTLRKTLKHKHSFKEMKNHLASQSGQRDNVIKGILEAKPFFPTMEKIFVEMGLPPELTRITLVESSFNISAYSKAGAAGVWQFMPASAKEFMMMRPEAGIDERISPLKSTVAAALLLKRSQRIFRSWPLSITSYNHGLTSLLSRKWKVNTPFSKVAYLFAACEKTKKGLGYASQNYFSEFLALLHADMYKDIFYGEPPELKLHLVQFENLKKPITAVKFALNRGVPLSVFQKLNPDILDTKILLPKGFRVAVPETLVESKNQDLTVLIKSKKSSKRI